MFFLCFFFVIDDLICDNCKFYIIRDNKIQISEEIEDKKPQFTSIRLTQSPLLNEETGLSSSFKTKFTLINEESTKSIKIQKNNNINTNDDNDLTFLSKSFSLKDVLRTFQDDKNEGNDLIKEEIVQIDESIFDQAFKTDKQDSDLTLIATEVDEYEPKIEDKQSINSDIDRDVESMLKNNQISKIQIDIIIKESYKLDNNLKLYFLMNVLNQNSTTSDDERLISTFKLKLFVLNEPELCLTNCLSIITNKNIFIYRIKDKTL